MNNYIKIKEFTEEEIKKQILSGQVEIDFLCRYISTRDRVYNALIDRLNEVENKLILVNESNVKYYNLYCDKLKNWEDLRKWLLVMINHSEWSFDLTTQYQNTFKKMKEIENENRD